LGLLPFSLPFCISLQEAPRLIVGGISGFSFACLFQGFSVKEISLAVPGIGGDYWLKLFCGFGILAREKQSQRIVKMNEWIVR